MVFSYFDKRVIDSVMSACFGFLHCEIHLARGLLRARLPPCSRGMGCGDIEGQQTNKYEYFQKLPCHKILLY